MIPAGMTLLLDTNTPVLSFLLIQGGKLIFDEADIELQSNIIMITDGGLLQVIFFALKIWKGAIRNAQSAKRKDFIMSVSQ